MAAIQMTLSELEALVRSLCFQKSTDTGLFTSTQLDSFINIAHRRIWITITNLAPSTLAVQSADKSLTSAGLSYSADSLDPNGVLLPTMVEWKGDDGSYRQVTYVEWVEKDKHEGPSYRVDGIYSLYKWTIFGHKIYFKPDPSSAQTIRVSYVPNPALLAAAGDVPLGGNLGSFHEVIGYRAAVMALGKDRCPSWLKDEYKELFEELVKHCRRRQAHRARRVLETEIYDW